SSVTITQAFVPSIFSVTIMDRLSRGVLGHGRNSNSLTHSSLAHDPQSHNPSRSTPPHDKHATPNHPTTHHQPHTHHSQDESRPDPLGAAHGTSKPSPSTEAAETRSPNALAHTVQSAGTQPFPPANHPAHPT